MTRHNHTSTAAVPDDLRLLDIDGFCELALCSAKNAARMRADGSGPAWITVGAGRRRLIRYPMSAVRAWLSARLAEAGNAPTGRAA